MKRTVATFLTFLLMGSVAIPGAHLTTGGGKMRDTHMETSECGEVHEADSADEGQKYQGNILILMKSGNCTEEQFHQIMTKYHLTPLQEGSIIPYCTVRLEKFMTEQELEELVNTLMDEEGIASAMISYISNISE